VFRNSATLGLAEAVRLFFFCSSNVLNVQTNVVFPGIGSGFESFPRTFLTLSNLVAGEDWDNHFDDASIQYP
jgi:hypothetical protein